MRTIKVGDKVMIMNNEDENGNYLSTGIVEHKQKRSNYGLNLSGYFYHIRIGYHSYVYILSELMPI
jgi:hypothetical protein